MSKLLPLLLLTLSFFILPSPALAKTTPPAVERQLIIKFKPTISQTTIQKKLQQYNITILEKIDALSALIAQVPAGQEKQIIKNLQKENLVIYAEPNYRYRYTEATSNTPQEKQALIDQLHIRKAWTISKGKGIKVALIDSGFYLKHIALSDNIGTVKNFSGEKSLDDSIGHGTRTLGIIAAKNTSKGIAGVCPECEFMLVKLGQELNSRTVAKGLVWAAQHEAKVINLSIVTEGYSKLTEEAINYTWDKGAVIIAAAGNEHTSKITYPGAYNHVIAVAALEKNEKLAPFSNYGDWVMLAAPGVNILSTQKDGSYGYVSGTSISAPIVSGIAALVWASKYGASNQTVVDRLCGTADKIKGTYTSWKCGRINAEAALTSSVQTQNRRVGLLWQIIPLFNK